MNRVATLPALVLLALLVDCGQEERTIRELRCAGEYGAAADRLELQLLNMVEDSSHDLAHERRLLEFLRQASALAPEDRAGVQKADCLLAERDAAQRARQYDQVYRLTVRQAELLESHIPGPNVPLADAHWYAGVNAYHTFRWEEAVAHFRRCLEITGALYPDGHADLSQLTFLLATTKVDLGENVEAAALFHEALRLQELHGGPRANLLNNYARLLIAQGDLVGAERAQRQSVELQTRIVRAADDPAAKKRAMRSLGLAQQNLASMLIELQQFDLAERLMLEAIDLLIESEPTGQPPLGYSHLILGRTYLAAGRLDDADRVLQKCIGAEGGWAPEHPNVVQVLLERGQLERRRDDLAAASDAFRRAVELAEQYYGADHRLSVEARVELARLTPDPIEARRLLRTAAASYEAVRWRSGTGLQRATAQVVSPYEDLAGNLARDGAFAEAFEMSERARARTLADLLRATRQRPLTQAELQREASLEGQLDDLEKRVAVLHEQTAAAGEEVGDQLAEARTSLVTAQAEWSAFQAELARRYPQTQGTAATLDQVQSALRAPEALVGWLDVVQPGGGREGWVYCLRPTGLTWRRLPPEAARSPQSWSDLRSDLAAVQRSALTGIRFKESTQAALRQVYRERVAPIRDLLDEVETLVVIPQGPLLGIPIEALMAEVGFLGETFACSYVPSASVLVWLRGTATSGQLRTALVVGDPPLQLAAGAATAGQGRQWSPELIAALPPLAGARQEAATLAGLIPDAQLLLGVDASEAELHRRRRELRTFDLVHLATHALVDDRQPELSALVLSQVGLTRDDALQRVLQDEPVYDGLLTAAEVMREWELDADLVTLSACRTGLGRQARGEGYIGLAHAFFRSGARNLVTSLWSVEDEATQQLMAGFYRELLVEGKSKAAALQAAKRALAEMEQDGTRPYRHPYYWAGFILMGAG